MTLLSLALAYAVIPLCYIALCFRLVAQRADGFSFLAQFILFGTAGGWFLAVGYYPSAFSVGCFLFLLTVAPLACLLSSFVLRKNKERHRYDSAAIRAGSIYVRLVVVAFAGVFIVTLVTISARRTPASAGGSGGWIYESGTWEDDARNWERAFGQKQPQEIKIVHSRYTRTPHFTHESQYFFEFAPDAPLAKAMSDPEDNTRIRPANNNAHHGLSMALHEKPSWFAPKTLDAYEVYEAKSPRDGCFLLIDQTSGAMFLTSRIGM